MAPAEDLGQQPSSQPGDRPLIGRSYQTVNRLHHLHYNFARPHRTLANPYSRTPAMAAGVVDHVWTCEEIAALLD